MPIIMGDTTVSGLTNAPAGSITPTSMYLGTVLQVVQAKKVDTWTSGGAGTTFYTVTGLAASITPQFNTSKVLVKINVVAGSQYWEIQGNLLRNSSIVTASQGTTRGSRTACSFSSCICNASGATGYDVTPTCFTYLDSPATISALTYEIALNGYSTYPIYVNRSYYDYDAVDYASCPISTITLMEIKA